MHNEKVNLDSTTFDLIRFFLKNTLKEILAILGAECGSCFLFDQGNRELILDSYFNSHEAPIGDIKRRVGEGISGKVVETKSPVLVSNIDSDPRFNANGFTHYHSKSFISIPLIGTNKVIGLMNITDKTNGEPFSEKDLQFAVTLCKYACVIVENLYNSSRLNEEKDSLHKQKMLLEKYATVGKLAASVVHEVNNPLDGIIRYANIILNQLDEQSVIKEYLLEIKKGLHRIGNITKSLLEFSHLINSDSLKTKRYVDLNELIDEALDMLKNKITGNIQIVKKCEAKALRVLDMGLSHVLVNIIKNALDAMPEGGVLEISAEIKDAVIYLSFKDTGVGISLAEKEQIFEPFFTTKSADKGTGLGLAICREIVHKYDGQINVQSTQGEGSIFTVLIPKKYMENEPQ